MSVILPRGVRNGNPGNLSKFPPQPFRGLAPADQQTDPDFYVFADTDGIPAHIWGLRAMAIVLLAYQNKHKLNTIRQITGRYASRPGVDHPLAYAQAVSRQTAIGMDDFVNLDLSPPLTKILAAMVAVENGGYWYPTGDYFQAVSLAYKAADVIEVSAHPAQGQPSPPASPLAPVAENSQATPPQQQNAAVQDTTAAQEQAAAPAA